VYLKVSPMSGFMHLGKKGKLSPRYVGPSQSKRHVCPVAYKVELPPRLDEVHDVFLFHSYESVYTNHCTS
jgi:hypothetical protein